MRKAIFGIIASLLALPAYAADGPKTYDEYVTVFNHAVEVMRKARAPVYHNCFNEDGYCLEGQGTMDKNIFIFIGKLEYNNGLSSSEICLSYPKTKNNRRCFASTGHVWVESFNGQSWDTINEISGNWQEGE